MGKEIDPTYSVTDYIRHAERYGVEQVWETALHDLELVIPRGSCRPRELGRLAARLANIEPAWKLSRDAAVALVAALVGEGVALKLACHQAGIVPGTFRRHVQTSKRGSETRSTGGKKNSESRPATDTPRVAKTTPNGNFQTLHCKAGNHDWQRPPKRGRKPRSCPEHS